jgi:hypothetical protein
MEIITEFVAKDTVKVWAYVYDDNNNLVDPTAVRVTITNPDGETAIENGIMTRKETGVYYYYFRTTPETDRGYYQGEVKVTDGAGETELVTTSQFNFKLK